MIENKNINISVSTGTILKIVGIFLVLAFAYLIRDIIITIFVALIFATLIEPTINKLEAKKIPRGVGVIIIYIALILLLVFVVRMLIPPIVEQVGLLATNFPDFWNKTMENFESVKQYSEEQGLLDNIKKGLDGLQSSLSKAATGAYGFIVSIFRNIVNFLVILVVTFYLVVQKGALSKTLKALAPNKYHFYLENLSSRIQQKIGGWARGQLLLGLIIGIFSFVGLIFILPRYALVLAIVAGITELIPYLGPVIGAIPAVFLGFTVSFGHGLAVLILYIVIQQVENNIIVPQVMKKQVGLNPVVIIISMLIGARLTGVVGIILAVPVVSAISLIVKDFADKSRISEIKNSEDRSYGSEPESTV